MPLGHLNVTEKIHFLKEIFYGDFNGFRDNNDLF